MTYQMLFMLGGGLGFFLYEGKCWGWFEKGGWQLDEAVAGILNHNRILVYWYTFSNGNNSELQCYYCHGSGFC